MRVRAFAPAKINLTLHVGPPRADGRHPLDSLVAFADVGDEIVAAFDAEADISLQVEGPFAEALAGEGDNLVVRAARLIAARKGRGRGARLTLVKNLPVASGIGGGSADAGAALRALDRLWGDPPSPERDLVALGGQLGADVPVCVASRSARMVDDGRVYEPIDLPTLAAVLINPGTAVPTASVYRAFDALGLGAEFAPGPVGPFADAAAAIAALAAARNDLEPAALTIAPVIGTVLAALRGDPDIVLARMSGSGATCFGLAPDLAAAHRAAARLAAQRRGWWIRATTLGAVDAAARPA